MRAVDRFLNYIHFNTASDENSETCPSTPSQWELARALAAEMRAMGITDADVDKNCYVYGSIAATTEGMPAIGLISHMDTANTVPSGPIHEQLIPEYDGGNVTLKSGDTLSPEDFPKLKLRTGKTLIVTDGHTLLGADDKAGVAEILTACEKLLNSDLPHGKVCVAFTPDEEIGRGADLFDISRFGADFAYTVDGDEIGGIEYENFNAAALHVEIRGRSVHPGDAKDKMVNAAQLAIEYNSMLPAAERPEHTEGREGFYHLCAISGETEHAQLDYIIRDHDRAVFEGRKSTALLAAKIMNERYGEGTVTAVIKDSYFNMAEIITARPEIIVRAEKAYRQAGVEPFAKPIRGGTDGARLSFEGLPCPNLATGGMNFHGRFECIAAEDMDVMSNVLFNLLTIGDI